LKREHIINFKKVEYLLPDKTCDRPYTLVLDLDETLVHFVAKEKKFKLRPGCIQFLKDMSQMYEIVIFTAAAQDYADFILNYIDRDSVKYIDHRLYRPHC
jgi:CTD small phosphatase-like protein 2